MSFLLSGIFSLFFMDEISEQGDLVHKEKRKEQGDSFLFCEIRSVSLELSWIEDEILDLDVDDEGREYNEFFS